MASKEFRAALQKWVDTMPLLDDALAAEAAAGAADVDTPPNPAPPADEPDNTVPTGGEGGDDNGEKKIEPSNAAPATVDAPEEKPRDISVHTAEGAHEASLEMRVAQTNVRIDEALTAIGALVERIGAMEGMITRFEKGIDLASKVDLKIAAIDEALDVL